MTIVAIRCKKHNRDQKLPLSLLQIVRDEAEGRVKRLLSADGSTLRKGPWESCPLPFADGLYCQHCLAGGDRRAVDVDVEDWPDLDLADRPVIFLDPDEIRSDQIAEKMRQAFPSVTQFSKTLEAVPASYGHSSVLDDLSLPLQKAIWGNVLGESGRLYSFQTDAIRAVLDGLDLVVTTPTASGKSLTYLLPILDSLLRDGSTTALYLSPLVALTEDQLEAVTAFDGSGTDWRAKGGRFSNYRVCRKLEFGEQSVTVARYDGQVSHGDRQYIRRVKPQYLLTTPDMLHVAILNGAFEDRQWAYFFAGLKYVVIDELHTYRGVFGASFANLIRRLKRICHAHGSEPQFICASATIQKPSETVEHFIGRKPVVVDGSHAGAPQNRRKFVLWSTPATGDIRALSTQAKDVLLFALRNRIRTIAFGRSISEINDIYRFVSAELKESGSSEIRITPFMRELTTAEKRNIIGELKEKTMHGVISTTALSMGIDIGSLSAAVIIGFPGSIAQLWQQAGRAGRSGEGLIVMIADNNPLDQFFVNHPSVLFDLDAEPVYFNPDNPYIVRNHLLCAARELAIKPDEIDSFGPSSRRIMEELVHESQLVREPDGTLILANSVREKFPDVPLRNLSFSIDVITEESREVIVQVDAVRAQKALHRYAHYQHINRYYEVTTRLWQ